MVRISILRHLLAVVGLLCTQGGDVREQLHRHSNVPISLSCVQYYYSFNQ